MSKGSGSQQNDAGGRPLLNMGSRSPVAIPGSPQQKEKADECQQSCYISHYESSPSVISRTFWKYARSLSLSSVAIMLA